MRYDQKYDGKVGFHRMEELIWRKIQNRKIFGVRDEKTMHIRKGNKWVSNLAKSLLALKINY